LVNMLVPSLVDFAKISEFLELERKTFIKINNLSEEDEFIRNIEASKEILTFLETIQSNLKKIFDLHPYLVDLFDKEFGSFQNFVQKEIVLEICFMDDCLFPEHDSYYFSHDGIIQVDVLVDYINVFDHWGNEKIKNHNDCQNVLIGQNLGQLTPHKLECQCAKCLLDFRNNVRNQTYDKCIEVINNSVKKIQEIDFETIEKVSNIYQGLQKDLDKLFFSIRYKLKRSVVNKLETQVKQHLREHFQYPSEFTLKYIPTLEKFFFDILTKQGLRPDVVEFDRFYKRLATNLWKDEQYLERELNKLVKTVLMLKRKDISASILKEYLGEFWVFSKARQFNRKIIYHMGPTNSGKTYNAINDLCKAGNGCYLAPLRLLAAELYDTMNAKGVPTTLLTGEECIEVKNSTHYSSTIEMARFEERFECAVIDEIQMISDSQRGWAWTRALVNINAKEVHVCGDHSAYERVQEIAKLCGDELSVRKYERMTELLVEEHSIRVGEMEKGDALIVFSRRNALKYKSDLEKVGFKVSVVYGRLGPEVRREQARKFDHGETDIIVATDAIAMGMNLPIRRIVFSTLAKYIDSKEYRITKSEILQISGRAGRYGRFPTGYVTCLTREENGINEIKEAMIYDLPQKDKCMVGPDLDIYEQVNTALSKNSLPLLTITEFLHLFNNMTFNKPFYCVELKEMIELAEMVEDVDKEKRLTTAEKFGFTTAPVDLNIIEHVQYFSWILTNYTYGNSIVFGLIDSNSEDIDYLERAIMCVELYQWLSRHFKDHHFVYEMNELIHNKSMAIEKLNILLSDKIIPLCSSCGKQLEEDSRFSICENCFKRRRFTRRPTSRPREKAREGGGNTSYKTGERSAGKPFSRGGKQTSDAYKSGRSSPKKFKKKFKNFKKNNQ